MADSYSFFLEWDSFQTKEISLQKYKISPKKKNENLPLLFKKANFSLTLNSGSIFTFFGVRFQEI